MRTKLRTQLTAATLLAAIGIGFGGCVSDQPVNSPCGVIQDSLIGVDATTRDGMRRLADHYERGVRAGCWARQPQVEATLKWKKD